MSTVDLGTKTAAAVTPVGFEVVALQDHFVVPNEITRGEFLGTRIGHPGAQALLVYAAMGVQTRFFTAIGNDVIGAAIFDGLKAGGVNCDHILVTEGAHSGFGSISVVRHGGDASRQGNFIDTNAALPKPSSVDLLGIDVLHIDARLAFLEVSISVASEVRANGGTVIFDTASLDTTRPEILVKQAAAAQKRLEVAHVSHGPLEFAQRFFGDPDMRPDVAADRLRVEFELDLALITMGAGGMQFSTDGESGFVPAIKVRPVNTFGAGDRVGPSLGLAHLLGYGPRRMATFASASAAMLVSGIAAIPTPEQVWAFSGISR